MATRALGSCLCGAVVGAPAATPKKGEALATQGPTQSHEKEQAPRAGRTQFAGGCLRDGYAASGKLAAGKADNTVVVEVDVSELQVDVAELQARLEQHEARLRQLELQLLAAPRSPRQPVGREKSRGGSMSACASDAPRAPAKGRRPRRGQPPGGSRPASPAAQAQGFFEASGATSESRPMSARLMERSATYRKGSIPSCEAHGHSHSPRSGGAKSQVGSLQLQPKKNPAEPYDQMWMGAKLEEGVLGQDYLKSIYYAPPHEMRRKVAMSFAGVFGLISMPFGPIGMAVGGTTGSLVGGIMGVVLDKRKRARNMMQVEQQQRKFKSLIRWASERLQEDRETMRLLEMVCLEFKPMADIADGSRNARKLLKLLDSWIAEKKVTRQLWAYMDCLLQHWRVLTREQFVRSMSVFHTLRQMYSHSRRELDANEEQFFVRMNRLLDHESVKSVMTHQQQYPTQGDKRAMECMIYADSVKRRPGRGAKSPRTEDPRRNARMGMSLQGHVMGSGSPRGEPDEEQSSDSEPSEDSEFASQEAVTERPSITDTYKLSSVPAPPQPDDKSDLRMVLRKPFFKDWDDFMDFDPNIKHKMPITLSEFELLLQKEAESTQGWDVCVDRKDIRVAKVQSGAGGVTLRAWGTVPGVDIHVAFYLFFDVEQRTKWDKVFDKMAVVKSQCQGSDILYSLLRVPGVTQRDFLQYRRVRLQDDGSILIVLRSAEDPDVPEDKRYIRAESHISGYVLRQAFDGGVPVLKIFLMSCSDVKGMIPKWIISYFAPKKPGEWIDALKKGAMEYQRSHPNYKEALKRKVEEFSGDDPFDFEFVPVELAPVLVEPTPVPEQPTPMPMEPTLVPAEGHATD